MEQEVWNNIQFDYLDDERSKEIISGLKTHDGYDVYYPEYHMFGGYGDIERNVYFIKAHLNDQELKKSRMEGLRNRYREVYQFVRNISEFVLLVQGRQAHVFADVSYYQDGVSIHLLEICTKNFEPEEMSQLCILTEKAMDFVYNGEGVPEYSYTDARARMTCERDNLEKGIV